MGRLRKIAASLAGLGLVVTALVSVGIANSAAYENTVRSYVHKMFDPVTRSSCSAVMIAPERAMTARHCIDMPSPLLKVNGEVYAVTEAYGNPDVDMAVIIVPGAPCPCAPVATERAQIDDLIRAVGYPLGLLQIVTEGALQGRATFEDGKEYLVVTARVAPGMSGGGLFNKQGELVGIISAMDEYGLLVIAVEVLTQTFGDK